MRAKESARWKDPIMDYKLPLPEIILEEKTRASSQPDVVDTVKHLVPPASLNLLPLAPDTHLLWFTVIPLTPFPAPSAGSSLLAHVAAMPRPVS